MLPLLPAEMATADQRARILDRAIVDLAEAMVMQHRIGETFAAVVVEANSHGGTVQVTNPAVRGKIEAGQLPLGQTVRVVLTEADVNAGGYRAAESGARDRYVVLTGDQVGDHINALAGRLEFAGNTCRLVFRDNSCASDSRAIRVSDHASDCSRGRLRGHREDGTALPAQ